MTASQKIRRTIDLSMTILSLLLMGGTSLFKWDGVHEILGTLLLVFWAIHIGLNCNYYLSLFKGRYNAYRVLQALINTGILVCAVLLAISGIILSNHVFSFMNIESGAAWARKTHLISSHWYFVLMSLHLGLHIGMMIKAISSKKDPAQSEKPSPLKIVLMVLLFAVCAFGLYRFIRLGLIDYLLYRQEFFMFDDSQPMYKYLADYISILIFFCTAGYYLSKFSKKLNKK